MLIRSIRDAFKSVVRNFSLSLASISCITITLIIVAIGIIASYNVEHFTTEIESDLTIVVFADNKTTADEIEVLKSKINGMKNVDSYEFVSKKEVKEQMQQESEVLNTVLEGWDENESPLKDTFKVKVVDVLKIGETADNIKKLNHVSTVRYGEGMVDKMISAFSSIEKATYVVVIALVLVTVFLIINTIKLTISARKREISIMRLVGASNFSIKTPFIIEGMILGALGSIVPIVVNIVGYTKFYQHFDGYLYSHLIRLIRPEPFVYQTSLIILGLGILVGMIGSAGAVRRYLKI
jgi:cell division transport system permease protein